MSVGQESSCRPIREQEGEATPGFASLSPVAAKFRVPGLFWERGYLKRTGGRGEGVSKQHLLCFVTAHTVILSQIYLKSSVPLAETRLKLLAIFCQL